MEIKKYKIEKAETRGKLEDQINDLIGKEQGWMPIGGIVVQRVEREEGEPAYGAFRTTYFQTMVQPYPMYK